MPNWQYFSHIPAAVLEIRKDITFKLKVTVTFITKILILFKLNSI